MRFSTHKYTTGRDVSCESEGLDFWRTQQSYTDENLFSCLLEKTGPNIGGRTQILTSFGQLCCNYVTADSGYMGAFLRTEF